MKFNKEAVIFDTPHNYAGCHEIHPEGLVSCAAHNSYKKRELLKTCAYFTYEEDYLPDDPYVVCAHCWVEDRKGYCEKFITRVL